MSGRGVAALGMWMAIVGTSIWVVARTPLATDLSAFLPRSPSPAQQMLVDQLREGVVSRMLLIGIEGAPPERLAELSERLRHRIADGPAFAYVNNGADDLLEVDARFLLNHRYLLSPTVAPERFSRDGLRAALERSLDLLASPTSLLLSRVLPADPTGELLTLIETLPSAQGPAKRAGVWFARDGERALLSAQTRAAGFDIDAQQRAIDTIRSAFDAMAGGSDARLLLSGPGAFAVAARASIKQDAVRLTAIAAGLVAAVLLLVYRSWRALGLTFMPVIAGAAVGAAAVALGFGAIHGVTLGFGVTLIGEAVDYAIYVLAHTSGIQPPRRVLQKLGSTLRIGLLTSVVGFGAMLFSGFPGLAQIALLSIVGLITALLVTQWILPALVPERFRPRAGDAVAAPVLVLMRAGRWLRIPLLLGVAACAAWLAWRGGSVWSDDLAALSPVSSSDRRLDASLRSELGAPDVRHLVLVIGATAEAALQQAERAGADLQGLVHAGVIAGFDSPAFYLPSATAQRARQAAIPDADTLRRNLTEALRGLPFRADAFEPFLVEAPAARDGPLLTRADLQGSGLALKVDALLLERRAEWFAVLPLRNVANASALESHFAPQRESGIVLLDLKRESDALYRGYRDRALLFSAIGAGAIALLLLASLRSPWRAYDVLLPLASAVVVTCAILLASGAQLTLFHLVALLLVAGVGSNYALFFERGRLATMELERTICAVTLCSVSTVIGFGLLALSRSPVLSAIGGTVAIGALLTLVFAAILSERRRV